MRSQDTKVNNVGSFGSVGKAGCLGLLALGLALVNPVSGFAFAEEDSEEVGVPAAQASDPVPSSVQIAFGEPVGTSSLTPISADGASALYSVRATVDVTNSGGYTVYLGSGKSELTGKNSGATINSVTSSSSYEDLPVNTWGYSYAEGETAGTTFSAMPANVRGVVLGSNNSTEIKADRKTFTLSFAAHVGNDKPADVYENEVTMSVISSPLEITNAFGIETMQEMTSEVCGEVEVGTTDRLRDVRDDKMYWVKKMPDNQCWMVQNLALDLGAEWPDASLSDYDVASTAFKPAATAATASAGTINAVYYGTSSWGFGDYVTASPEVVSDCGVGKVGASACSGQFVSALNKMPSDNPDFYVDNGKKVVVGDEYDAHYLIGNYYQWNAATAGTGGTMTSGQAAGSICPKGWKLPTGGAGGNYATLIQAGGIGSDVTKLTGAGYFFVRGGLVEQNTNTLFASAGNYGGYWTSMPVAANNFAYYLYFGESSNLYPTNTTARYIGFSVRCIAR